MKKIIQNIFLLLLVLVFACSPPRGKRYSSQSKKNISKTQPKVRKKRFGKKNITLNQQTNSHNNTFLKKPRFSDTTFIDLNQINDIGTIKKSKAKSKKLNNKSYINPNYTIKQKKDVIKSKNIKLIEEYKEAIKLFNNDNFVESCPIFEHFMSILPSYDTLKYEAMFYWSECLIQKKEIKRSINILLSLIQNKHSTPSIIEKSIVRIGHLYCLLNQKQTANKYFNLLLIKFPNSVYKKLANCSVVNK